MTQQKALVLHPNDNVAVALATLAEGETVTTPGSSFLSAVVVRQPIAPGHKIALCALARGQTVVKYGQPIGVTTQEIGLGEHVHTHNVISSRAG